MTRACAEWRGDIGAYIVGALDREGCAAVRRHLAACPVCRTEYDDLRPVRDWLARLAPVLPGSSHDRGSLGGHCPPGR